MSNDQLTCAFCDEPTQGNHSIHRDGFCDGPEVDLCDGCGSEEEPSCPEIWLRIAQVGIWAQRRTESM